MSWKVSYSKDERKQFEIPKTFLKFQKEIKHQIEKKQETTIVAESSKKKRKRSFIPQQLEDLTLEYSKNPSLHKERLTELTKTFM